MRANFLNVLAFSFLAFTLPACGVETSEQTVVDEVSDVCARLASETGRDYEVIIGQFVLSKFDSYSVSNGDDVVIANIPMVTAGGTVEAVFTAPSQENRRFLEELRSRIGQEEFDGRQDTPFTYAFCGARSPYIKNKYVYAGVISTLKITEK